MAPPPGKEAEAPSLALAPALALVLALAAAADAATVPALVTPTEKVPPLPALLAERRAQALPVVAEARSDELPLQAESAEPQSQRGTAAARSAQALGRVVRSCRIQLRRVTAWCRPSHYWKWQMGVLQRWERGGAKSLWAVSDRRTRLAPGRGAPNA